MSEENGQSKLSRRRFLEAGSAVLVAAAALRSAGSAERDLSHGYPHRGQREPAGTEK